MNAARQLVIGAAVAAGALLVSELRHTTPIPAGGFATVEPPAPAPWFPDFFPMTAIDWSEIKYFTPADFGSALADLDPRVVYAADALRQRLGAPLVVTPAEGGIVRYAGSTTSRHYAVGRLGDALDLMPSGVDLYACYLAALDVPEIGGFGAYPDWRPRPGIHIDCRPRGLGGKLATWMGVNVEGRQNYVALNVNALRGVA